MRLGIRYKALLFIGAASIGTSLLLGTLLLWGMDMAEQLIHSHAYSIGSSVTAEAENFAREETRKRLEGTLQLQASYLDAILSEMGGDVHILADKMTQLMQAPSLSPRRVYDPRIERVASGQLYVLAGASGEVGLDRAQGVAAIEDTMRNLVRNYHACPLRIYVGSREGWSLHMDFMADENAPVTLPSAAMATAYDVREQAWYREGMKTWKAASPVYPPLHNSLGNEPVLACVMAFEDAQGFAGVVGISATPQAIQEEVRQEMPMEDKITFVLNDQGQIVFSTLTEGILRPGDPKRDLRQEAHGGLAEAASSMILQWRHGFFRESCSSSTLTA